MFSNIVAGKDLISKIYRSYNSIKNKKKKQRFTQKWAEDLNRYFFQRRLHMAKKQMQRCSTSLIISEKKNQI